MICTLLLQLLILKTVVALDAVTKDLLTPLTEFDEACGYASCPTLMEGMLNVHIVPSTHGELGYTRTFYQHFTGYDDFYVQSKVNMKQIIDATITSLWENRNRKFTFSDFPYLFHWWKNRDGTVHRMVYELLRQGRLFFVGGGWSMSDEATTSYHAIIDHFTYSLRKLNATFLECGRPLVTWQADVYGHSKEFASLMAQMGFDGHFINPISFEDELSRMRSKSLEFIWRGSDDLGDTTDIYTHKLFDGYWTPPGFCFGGFCNDPLFISTDVTFSNVEERIKLFIKHMTSRQAPFYTTKNVMVIMGKRLGYHDAGLWFNNIDKLIAGVNSRQSRYKDKVHLFYSTPACYLKAVHEATPKLSTKQDDFYPFTYDTNTHTAGMFTSRPVIKFLAREIHLYSQIAKQLQLFAKLGNNDQRFEDIMWIAGVMQDHTIITGGMRPNVSEYYARKVYLAKELCLQMFRPAFNILRQSPKAMVYYACPFNISSCWTLEGDRFFIVIYNPLSWPVTIPVRLPVARGIYHVFDPKGEKVNHSIVPISDLVTTLPERGEFYTEHELVFIAEKLPPMGYRSYYFDQIQAQNRAKRSIIKKINKNKKKKYLARQTNNLKIDEKSLLDDIPDYEYFEDATEKGPKIQVANVSASKETEDVVYNDYIMTPKAKFQTVDDNDIEVPTLTSVTVSSSSTSQKPTPTTTSTITVTRTTTPEATTRVFVPVTSAETPISSSSANLKTTPSYPEYYYEEVTEKDSGDESTYRKMEQSGYHGKESYDNFIKNEYIQINFNSKRKLTNITLSNGVHILFDIQMCYYISDDPEKLNQMNVDNPNEKKKPGAFVFRPMDPQPILVAEFVETKVIKSEIVEELQIKYANYAGVSLRLYKGLPTIELDWIIGPIPIDDAYGKDVFIRYRTDIDNKGVFYTDSNGRQFIKRIRDQRPTYNPNHNDHIPGNFYPVTSKIYIEDKEKNVRLSVFTDRAQGGTCLLDGHIDLMLHRRIFTDDGGYQAFLNETEHGRGLIVRGTHNLYLSKANFRQNKVFEKKFAKEIELAPKVFASIHPSYFNISYSNWLENTNEYSAIRMKVPVGIHVLTIEKWNDDKLLLRLENYLEISDVVRSGLKTVFIKDLFIDFRIVDARETTLSGHMWLEDFVPLQWQKERFTKNFNDVYGNSSNLEFAQEEPSKPFERVIIEKGIDLKPQQIRTFVISYVRV